MRWPPNHAWTSSSLRDGYRHFAVRNYGGKGDDRWVELLPVLQKDLAIRVSWIELSAGSEWFVGWRSFVEPDDRVENSSKT